MSPQVRWWPRGTHRSGSSLPCCQALYRLHTGGSSGGGGCCRCCHCHRHSHSHSSCPAGEAEPRAGPVWSGEARPPGTHGVRSPGPCASHWGGGTGLGWEASTYICRGGPGGSSSFLDGGWTVVRRPVFAAWSFPWARQSCPKRRWGADGSHGHEPCTGSGNGTLVHRSAPAPARLPWAPPGPTAVPAGGQEDLLK